ncbi:MAG: indole-3-glycerol phosphate synthase TrpC [Firmicutes bacterium]|nr:indole-3-glycerol phosphate synthase TrpC [Bacillota bacterium]
MYLEVILAHKKEEIKKKKARSFAGLPQKRNLPGGNLSGENPASWSLPGGSLSGERPPAGNTPDGSPADGSLSGGSLPGGNPHDGSLSGEGQLGGNRFRSAIAAPGISVVAEIKRASPSRGPIAPRLDPVKIAALYEENGAAAISVLTEENFFRGGIRDLRAVRTVTRLPVLAKDFFLDPCQIEEAVGAGADAVLLIMAILSRSQAAELAACARENGLAVLAEVHEEAELEPALAIDPDVVGINNRDLKTFRVSLETTFRICPLVPKKYPVISESGIKNRRDLLALSALGVDGFLIGETLAGNRDPGAALRELLGCRP